MTVAPSPAPREASAAAAGRGFAVALAGIFLAALALRLAYLYLLHERGLFFGLFLDSKHYELQAAAIRAGRGPGDHPYLFSPLYPYFLALFAGARGELAVRSVQVVQALAGSATAVLAAIVGRRTAGPAAGVLAGLLVALHGPFVHLDSLILVASLQTLFVTAALALAVGAGESRRRWLGVGLALGVAAALRPTLLAVVVVVVALLVVRGRRFRLAAVVLVGVCAIVTPFAARNVIRTGQWVLLSVNGGVNFWVGNHAGSSGLYGLPAGTDFVHDPLSKRQAEQATGHAMTDKEASRWWMRRALSDVRSAPLRWLRLLALKALYFLHPLEISQLGSGFHWYREHAWPLRWPLDARWLFVLAAAGLAVRRTFDREAVQWLLCFILPYAAGICLFFVTGRHRSPIMPAVAVLAAGSAVGLVRAWRDRERARGLPRPVLAAATWIVLAGVATHALYERRGAALFISEATGMEDRHRGMALFDAGRYEEAVAAYRDALQLREDPLTRTNLANALQAAGRLEAAAAEYRRVLESFPDSPLAWYNYGVLLTSLAAGEAGARSAFEQALRLAPLMPDPRLRLAELDLAAGRPADAAAGLERCIELASNNEPVRRQAQALLERARAELAAHE